MPKYLIRYESVESYEKQYEADSWEDAQQMYHEDHKLFESSPRYSEIHIIDIEEIV